MGNVKKDNKIAGLFKDKEGRKLAWLLIFGAFIRLFYIGNIPGNKALFVDEMFSGYEAWSLLHFGIDSHGYHFPVYLEVWGSGMSVLQAWLQMPFVLLFGLNSFSIRIPAAIVGCFSLYAFYYICKMIKDEKFALFALFIFAIMPWHIMQSRWGLDCNMFSGFCTFALAFVLKAKEDKRFLPVAAFFFGLTLYTYALTWSVMPIIVFGALVFLFASKSVKFDRYLIASAVIFTIIAIPLLLFVMVNYGIIEEITTPFISIPKLWHFRTNELDISARSLIANAFETLKLFISQDDGRVSDVTPLFGLYYKFSNIIIFLGIALSAVSLFEEKRDIFRNGETLIWYVFIGGVIVGSIVQVYFTRINIIHMPMTYFLATGLYFIAEKLGDKFEKSVILVYGIACIAFLAYFFTVHDDVVAKKYLDGAEATIKHIEEMKQDGAVDSNATVHVLSDMQFVHVLFYKKYPTDKYVNEVEWSDVAKEEGSLIPRYVDDYDFTVTVDYEKPTDPIPGDVYICGSENEKYMKYMQENNMEIEYFSNFACGVAK